MTTTTTTILALHGYLQNGDLMMKKLMKILRTTKEKVLICPTGPYVVDAKENKYGWWPLLNKEDIHKPSSYGDLSSVLNNLLRGGEQQPDILIAFSQGTVLATIAVSQGILKPKKMILISGLGIMDDCYLPNSFIDIPTQFIVGERDELVSLDQTKQLMKYFTNTKLISHSGGHVIPNKFELSWM